MKFLKRTDETFHEYLGEEACKQSREFPKLSAVIKNLKFNGKWTFYLIGDFHPT